MGIKKRFRLRAKKNWSPGGGQAIPAPGAGKVGTTAGPAQDADTTQTAYHHP